MTYQNGCELMLNFFPTLNEDELLISAICRYKIRCGFRNRRSLERSVYGDINVTRSAILPLNVEAIVEKHPPTSKVDSNELILKHTLYPFYTAYLSMELSTQIYRIMRSGNGVAIERMLGFPSSPVKPSSYLKYCPLCYQEDLNVLGESYWRRLHQVPGVFYCLDHKVLLKTSDVLIIDGRISDYITATDACSNSEVNDSFPQTVKEQNLKYVKAVNYLLKSNMTRKSLAFVNSFYIDRLREQGFTSKNGSIYLDKLLKAFINHFSPEYLELMQSSIMKKENTWLRRFVNNNGKNRSPLRHLLLHGFLNIEPVDLFETKDVIGRLKPEKKKRVPKFNLEERRKKWLELVADNPNANRAELKKLGKGLNTWMRAYDLEWYEKVTPKKNEYKKRASKIDYKKRDEECLKLVKKGFEKLISKEGKPTRITLGAIRREVGAKRWIEDKRLVKTQKFIDTVYEEIDDYRIRKIKWAIKDMEDKGLPITPYKVQVYAGLRSSSTSTKELILRLLDEIIKV